MTHMSVLFSSHLHKVCVCFQLVCPHLLKGQVPKNKIRNRQKAECWILILISWSISLHLLIEFFLCSTESAKGRNFRRCFSDGCSKSVSKLYSVSEMRDTICSFCLFFFFFWCTKLHLLWRSHLLRELTNFTLASRQLLGTSEGVWRRFEDISGHLLRRLMTVWAGADVLVWR